MNEKGAYGLLDAFINSRDDASGTWFILEGRNLGLSTRERGLQAYLRAVSTPRGAPS